MNTEKELRFWPPAEVMKMAGELKHELKPYGLLKVGEDLTRLARALAATSDRIFLLGFLNELRILNEVKNFETIGKEAIGWHNTLSNATTKDLTPTQKNDLRDATTRWRAVAAERVADLYLATPSGPLNVKNLLEGAEGFLQKQIVDFLTLVEHSDLDEACLCILAGSSTAAEFISLRVAESLLKRWYTWKTTKTIERKGWGYVFEKLEKEYPPSKPPVPPELAAMGYLKLRRDEIAHPDRSSTGQDAMTTFMTVCSLVAKLRTVMLSTLPISASQKKMREITRK